MSRVIMLFSLSLGIFSVGFLPELPDSIWLLLPAIVGFFLYVINFRALACLLWGMTYGVFWGHYTLSYQLPEELNPVELVLKGEVVGLPRAGDNYSQFYFKVLPEDPLSLPSSESLATTLKKIRLNWYGPSKNILPGQVWSLRVKLRRPRGTVNPGGFDYQAWLLRQGVSATGYVRSSSDNELLSTQNSLSALRFKVREAILKLPATDEVKSLIIALTVGDRSMITSELWDNLALAGVVHLMVISGMHIGIIAFFFYVLGSGIARPFCVFIGFSNTHYWGSICSLFASVLYASLAGLSLPTQRALVMVSVVIVAFLLNRKISRGLGFGMALSGVAIIDPLAFLSAGFWLSFGAVACLLWLVPVYVNQHAGYIKNNGGKGAVWGLPLPTWKIRLKQFFYVQWLLFIPLTILLMLYQLPISWFAPWINLFAIPWVGFFIVPLCLLGSALLLVNEAWSLEVWTLASWQLNYFIDLIHMIFDPNNLSAVNLPRYLPLPKIWPVCLTLISVLILFLLPRGIPGKYLIVPMLFVLSLVSIGDSKNGGKDNFLTSIIAPYLTLNKIVPLRVSVLDVGQGLSVVVETEGASGKHTLVYDVGPGYEDGFNMADAVVIPYLRYRGQTALDMLIVSHGDNDHAGATMNIIEVLSPSQITLGEDISKGRFTFSSCSSGHTWQWDNVNFEFLHPKEKIEKESNNRSCVLQISYRDQIVILPGDIESKVESQLQTHMQGYKVHHKDRATLLVAPHHGSKTSSSPGFVSLLAPKHVVFSAGYKHHFGHPADSVLQRYKDVGSTLWTTADHGAVEFTWDQYGQLTVSSRRVDGKRYWY